MTTTTMKKVQAYRVNNDDGEGYAEVCDHCAAARRTIPEGEIDYSVPIGRCEAGTDCQICQHDEEGL